MVTPEHEVAAGPAHWKTITDPYRGAETWRSAVQLSTTFTIFVALWVAMYFSLQVSYLLTLALSIPTAGFLVRLFMIQHDCGHGCYFRNRWLRDGVGFVLGVLTLTPYRYWAQTHLYHHSHSGDLDFRGVGDIVTLTVDEYRARTPWQRFLYRLYRNPVILFGIGPAFHFIVKHRYPWDIPARWRDAWRSVWLTNLALVGVLVAAYFTMGLGTFFMIQAPITLVSCSLGVWLFYVQHQFEDTYWHHHKDWNYFEAALHGSSHLVLPKPLQWLTASIGIHHVHHLNSQIPNYKLQECLDANPELQCARKITMMETFSLLPLTLWDENNRQLISFRQMKKMQPAAQNA